VGKQETHTKLRMENMGVSGRTI